MLQYYVSKPDGTVDGPLPVSVIRASLETGVFSTRCMIWQEGMEGWQSITLLTKREYDNPFSAIKYAVTHITFQGRATRKEYWMFYLGMVIIFAATGLLIAASVKTQSDALKMMLVILIWVEVIFYLIVQIPLEARRLHDIGYSGWLQLLRIFQIIPYVGTGIAILFLVWECRDSKPGRNEYGISDKYPD